MEDIKALVWKNDLELPQDKINSLVTQLNRRTISYLAPDKEAGPFLLYCCGDSIEEVAAKTNYPHNVLLLTSLQYKWPDKAKALQREADSKTPEMIQKDLANQLLIATYMSMQKDLGDVIAGRKKAKDCPLIPRKMQDLEKLMQLVIEVNKKPSVPPIDPGPRTVINADNVQVNQIEGKPDEVKVEELTEEQKKKKKVMLDALDE